MMEDVNIQERAIHTENYSGLYSKNYLKSNISKTESSKRITFFLFHVIIIITFYILIFVFSSYKEIFKEMPLVKLDPYEICEKEKLSFESCYKRDKETTNTDCSLPGRTLERCIDFVQSLVPKCGMYISEYVRQVHLGNKKLKTYEDKIFSCSKIFDKGNSLSSNANLLNFLNKYK